MIEDWVKEEMKSVDIGNKRLDKTTYHVGKCNGEKS